MGDSLKLAKDKRHRSSSSLSGNVLEGTRSERKLDKNASIPEMDDQFAIAEGRCDDLQEKIDLIKTIKRKRKLKKRSMTKVTDPPMTRENVPFISVRTQPKKKVSQQAARLRRLVVPPNPTRGYLDPATVEQHQMIGQVRGYNNAFKHPERIGQFPSNVDPQPYFKQKRQRSHDDGDSLCSQRSQVPSEGQLEVACEQDEIADGYFNVFNAASEYPVGSPKKPAARQTKQPISRRRHVPRDISSKDRAPDHRQAGAQGEQPVLRRRQKNQQPSATQPKEERPVVELFNKSRTVPANVRQRSPPTTLSPASPPPAPQDKKSKKVRNTHKFVVEHIDLLENTRPSASMEPKHSRHPRRIKNRNHGYELPTVASKMKQAGIRNYYSPSNRTKIPFVVSKSTAPSHNIGVNIQQVLNGLKIQQPLTGIPLTIAYHMGLGHLPTYRTDGTVDPQPSLKHQEINAIRVGRRLLRLPSCKHVSYNQLLTLYSEGDGMVPRFLRAISRPNYFYTSMYNLAINREDFDCATSKGRSGSQEAKQTLAEYASLYREYECIDKCIKEGNHTPELEQRKEELTKQLAAREEHIRRVVQEYRMGSEVEQKLRASVSTADEGYRHSIFKIGEPPQ